MRARIVDDLVVEILYPINGFAIEDCFHPDVLIGTVPCDGNAKIGEALPEVIAEEEVAEEVLPVEPDPAE